VAVANSTAVAAVDKDRRHNAAAGTAAMTSGENGDGAAAAEVDVPP
jgi:hypothetical protein